MRIIFEITLSDDETNYISSCARIRQISCSRLAKRLFKRVCEDQLALAVLDDDSKPSRKQAGERTRSRYNPLYQLKH